MSCELCYDTTKHMMGYLSYPLNKSHNEKIKTEKHKKYCNCNGNFSKCCDNPDNYAYGSTSKKRRKNKKTRKKRKGRKRN